MLYTGATLSWSWRPMDTHICPFRSSSRNLLACQRFVMSPDEYNYSWGWKNMGSYDGLRWAHECPDIFWCFTMFLWSFPNYGRVWGLLNCVSIRHQLQDTVKQALMRYSQDKWIWLVEISRKDRLCFMSFYILTTSKVISKRVRVRDSTHSWKLYSAAPLKAQGTL